MNFVGLRKTGAISLSGGLVALVDAEDVEELSKHKWHCLRSGVRVYARSTMKVGGKFKTVLMHRFLTQPQVGVLIDHANGDGLDNRRENLRFASFAQNARNAASRGESGHVGVRARGGKYHASISPNGLTIHLGMHATAELAAQFYNAAAIRCYGEFARLNDVPAAPDLLTQVISEKRKTVDRLMAEIAALEG